MFDVNLLIINSVLFCSALLNIYQGKKSEEKNEEKFSGIKTQETLKKKIAGIISS